MARLPLLFVALLLGYASGMAIGSTAARSKVLKSLLHYHVEQTRALALMSLVDECTTGGTPVITEFLSPLESNALLRTYVASAAGSTATVVCTASGGYDTAERKRVFFTLGSGDGGSGPLLHWDAHLCLLDVQGVFGEGGRVEAAAEDFREELLRQGRASGVSAGGLGDVIVTGNKGCQVVCTPHAQDALISCITAVRDTPVRLARLSLTAIHTRAVGKAKELVLIEASTRADAIISSALAISRASAARLIDSGDVRIDYRPLKSGSYSLKSGEVVVVRDRGRLAIGEIGTTLKQKYRIKVTKINA